MIAVGSNVVVTRFRRVLEGTVVKIATKSADDHMYLVVLDRWWGKQRVWVDDIWLYVIQQV